jgi:hypothetical protein
VEFVGTLKLPAPSRRLIEATTSVLTAPPLVSP